MRTILFSFLLLISLPIFAKKRGKVRVQDPNGFFSGRVSKVNLEAGIIRVRVDFNNQRYVNKKDKVEFYDQHDSSKRCKAYVLGKTSNYILLKVPEIDFCNGHVFMANGAYVKFYSQDLANNLKMGRELVDILMKKNMALQGRLTRTKKELDNFVEKINAVNARYKVLRDKLELEWRDEIHALEEDHADTLTNYRELQRKSDELNHKLERYKLEEDNLIEDRWALDPKQYFRK
jgi:hypothetical protein